MKMVIPQAGFYPFWFWNGVQEEKEICRQLAEIADSGCKGVVLHARVGNQIDYLSGRWFELVECACAECAKLQLKVWIYDEEDYPSGNAGHKIQAMRPDLKQKCWKWKEQNGKLEFFIEECDRHVDTLHPDTVKEFITLTHEEYKKHIGHYFGNTVEAVYTDDESFLIAPTYGIVWSETLEKEFQKVYGKTTEEILPAMVKDLPESAEVRKTYYRTAQKLFLENFIRPQQQWCRENGLIYTGHLSGDEGPRSLSIKNFCSAEPYYKQEDIPAVDDFLLDMGDLGYLRRPYSTREVRLNKCFQKSKNSHPLYTYKLAASVANRSGVNQVSAEIWAFLGWNMPPEFLEGQTLFAIGMGQTLLTPHAFYYTLEGKAKQDCPPSYFIQQPYWNMLKKKMPVWSRLAEKTASSKAVADTVLVIPEKFLELHDGKSISGDQDTALDRADREFQQLVLELMRRHIGFDLIEEKELASGFGKMEYKNIIHADFTEFDKLSPLWKMDDSEEILIQCRCDSDGKCWYFIQNLSGKEWKPSAKFPEGMSVLYDPLRERAVFRGERFPERFVLPHGGVLLLLPEYQGREVAFEKSEFYEPSEKYTPDAPGLRKGPCGEYEYSLDFNGVYSVLEISALNGVMEISVNHAPAQVLWGSGRISIAEWCREGENHLQIRFANSAGLRYGDPEQVFGIRSIYLTK
ncbi:MAG: hypothetical protein IJZ19_06570 [Lentisphaeria bacterium]|nr:hypothetical protein [Lentisphaeria bacterium]